jgi:hypothetical protein
MEIPKDLFNSISKDETILFISEKLINNRTRKIKRIAYISTYLAIVIGFYSWILGMTIPDWIKGEFISSDLILVFLPLIVVVFFPFLFRMMSNIDKKDEHFLFTDKNLYIYTYAYEGKSQWIQKIKLESIIGIIYKKRRWDEKGDCGSIEIIQEKSGENNKDYEYTGDDLWTPIYKLNNIPHFKEFQTLTESILYEFGSIENKWIQLKNSSDLQIPLEYQVSKEKLTIVEKKRKRQIYIMIIIPSICAILTIYFIYQSFDFGRLFSEADGETESMFPIIFVALGLFLAPYIGVCGLIIPINERRKMKRRSSPIGSSLIVDKEMIVYLQGMDESQLALNESISLRYLKVHKPSNTAIKWEENVDGIQIKQAYDSEKEIIFGPIDNFSSAFCSLFYYFILRKAELGFLLTKEQLIKKKIEKSKLKTFESKKKVLYTDAEPAEKRMFSFTPSEPSEAILEEFKNYLNPGEKILLTYKPTIKLTKNLLIIVINLGLFILAIYLIFASVYQSSFNLFFIIAPIFIMIFPMMFCVLQCFMLPSKKLQKHSIFVFTNEKLLSKYSKHYCITPYRNIYSVGQDVRFKKKHMDIHINLNKSIDSSPFMNKFSIFITRVPKESQLLDQIRYLKDHAMELKNY